MRVRGREENNKDGLRTLEYQTRRLLLYTDENQSAVQVQKSTLAGVYKSHEYLTLRKCHQIYTHAQGNLNSKQRQLNNDNKKQKRQQPSQTHREDAFMVTNICSACVWCVCARLSFFFLPFLFFILKRRRRKKNRQVLKRYESTILDDLTGRNYIKLIIS